VYDRCVIDTVFDDASHTFTVVNSTAKVARVVKVPVAHSRLVIVDRMFSFAILC